MLNQDYNFNMENFIEKVGDYIDNNSHWFLVGNQNLLQLAKTENNEFKLRTNMTDYNESLVNFLSDKEIEFTDWKVVNNDELKRVLYNNIYALNDYVKDSSLFN